MSKFKVGDIVVVNSMKHNPQPWIITSIETNPFNTENAIYEPYYTGIYLFNQKHKAKRVIERELRPAPRISPDHAKLARLFLL